jgi:hypothetical protein
MVLPFSVFRRTGRPSYMVAFKNELIGKCLPAVSTRKEKYADAVKQAWAWYREGIPRKRGPIDVPADSVRKLLGARPVSSATPGCLSVRCGIAVP